VAAAGFELDVVPSVAWEEYTLGRGRTGCVSHRDCGAWSRRRLASAALDAACGTGRLAARLRDRGHQVIGVDASRAMPQQARRRCRA